MEFKGSFSIGKTVNLVKEFLLDPKQFAECLPGIQNYEVVGDTFRSNFKLDISQMKIPHMSTLTTVINAKILDKADGIEISGNGRSAGVGVKFNIVLKLSGNSEYTKLEWRANIDLGLLSRLLGDENIIKIAEANINHIISCISTKLS
ncbi:carbon monoxide dehydrogenase subunit G [Sulfolobus tengchongensis]|uniref:Carbon monoxide dehydrogenase subunit G n=1 Tax=Sulfolobus tengchongensis TaxID=207809 RepID=A0AAX4L494_9CREN